MRKQSYIRIDHLYTVPLPYLRSFTFNPRGRAYKMRLSEHSYATLMEFLALPAQPWVDGCEIWETADRRLDAWLELGVARDACAAAHHLDEVVLDQKLLQHEDWRRAVQHEEVVPGVSFTGCVVDDGLTHGTTYEPPVLLDAELGNDGGSCLTKRYVFLSKILGSLALISGLGICIWHFQFWPFHS